MNKLSLKTTTLKSFNLNKIQKKFLNKSYRPTMYNLRLYFSNMRRNEHGFSRWDGVWAPEGFDKTKTDRNPENFKYKTNLFSHTVYELRHIYGDAIYQMMRRRHRLSDPFMKYVMPTAFISLFLLSGQHLFFFVSRNNYNNNINILSFFI